MNATLPYRVAVLALVAAALHVYENVAQSAEASLRCFLWAMAPYGLCLGIRARSAVGVTALAGVAVPLVLDTVADYAVFIHPTRSTAALAMIFMPLWNTLLICPAAMLFTWFLSRNRKKSQFVNGDNIPSA